MKTGPEYTDESVASSGWILILYQNTNHCPSQEESIHTFFERFWAPQPIFLHTTSSKQHFKRKSWKQATQYTDESVASSGWMINLYQIQISLLIERKWFMNFSNDFELRNQYFCILPSQNNIFIGNNENRPKSTLMNL